MDENWDGKETFLHIGAMKSGGFVWVNGTYIGYSQGSKLPAEFNITKALKTGQYGRCVWDCDNDVVDHQVVNMLFEDGKTASFTMTAFTEHLSRKTHIFGTRGELYGDGRKIEHFDFLTDKHEIIDTKTPDSSITGGIMGGHGGGDYGIMKNFVAL